MTSKLLMNVVAWGRRLITEVKQGMVP